VSAALPAAADNQPLVQVRIITSDATGSDEWIGIDDITISSSLAASGVATPNIVQQGGTTVLTVSVAPGANPLSTGITVTADLTPIDGPANQTLFDDGVAPDLVAGDNVFSSFATVPNSVTSGAKLLAVSVHDAQNRTASTAIALTVTDAPAPQVVTIPFFQDWSNTALISADDDWTRVPGIVGYRGDGLTGTTGVDPQIVVAESLPVDVNANRLNPDNFTTGGVAEFEIGDPTIALQGSGTARAPNLVLQLDTTGNNGILVSYDLRDIDGSIDNATQPVALQYRLGSTGLFINIPAAFVPDATTGPGLANQVTHVTVLLPAAANNQPLVQIRFITTDASGSDEWVGIDNISVTSGIPSGVGTANPALVAPGDSTRLTVAVTPGANPPSTGLAVTTNLSAIGGSTLQAFFDDGTNGDLSANDNIFSFQATVAAGTPVGVLSLPGTVSDAQFRASTFSIPLTIELPAPFFAIDQIQGDGTQSPLKGFKVLTQGVVTGVKTSGFFIQTPDGQDDGNALTSEGIFVFTSSTPPPAAAIGNVVSVKGFVQEFVPGADPFQPPVTEIGGSPQVTLLGQSPLPLPIDLTGADTPPGVGLDVLERYEGMRVRVASLTVTGPTQGNVSESTATSTSNGVFYGVITGVNRPFREPGIQLPDPLPTGAPATVPRFDGNPERLRVDSDGLVGSHAIEVASGDEVLDLVGPLDYSFRTYQVLPDPASPPTVAAHRTSSQPVPMAGENQFTVAAANMERFFDTVDDPGIGEPVLTPTAFSNRLNKASLYIRNVMRTPDILGVEEVENLSALQSLAARVNADATAAGQPDPKYVAFLEEGNDIGGIDSGFLVKSARAAVLGVEQVGKATTYINPLNNQPELLNDRPPLVLSAVVQGPTGSTFPVTVIVNHLRSLSGVDDAADGARVRAKRRAQAEFLANYLQARQNADPNEHIISIGDYNAFQVNDGYVDSIGTIKGAPAPPDQVTLSSPDLVNPDFIDLVDLAPPEERYSFSFDGNAQVLDHELITQNLLDLFAGVRLARNNADFPETARNNPNAPERISDHDPVVGYFNLPLPTATTLVSSVNPSLFGQSVTFTATVLSSGNPVTEGSVTFLDDGTPLASAVFLNGNGSASFSSSGLSVGDHAIEARYSGTQHFNLSAASLEQAVRPGLSIDDVTMIEGNSGTTTALFMVSLSAPSTQAVTVDFTTGSGTALAGSDFVARSGTVVFEPGESTETIAITVNADALNEVDETFLVNLSNPVNALLLDPQGVGTITNDDPPPSISINHVTVTEPDTGTVPAVFTVSLSAPSGMIVLVDYRTADGTALAGADYVAASGSLSFAPGETTKTATIAALADKPRERIQTFFVNLSNPVNASLANAQGVGTIFDAAAPQVASFTPIAGTVGSSITITGSNFTAVKSVKFNGVSAAFKMRGVRTIIAIVPAGASDGPITVSNASGTGTSAGQFTVITAPTISNFVPLIR